MPAIQSIHPLKRNSLFCVSPKWRAVSLFLPAAIGLLHGQANAPFPQRLPSREAAPSAPARNPDDGPLPRYCDDPVNTTLFECAGSSASRSATGSPSSASAPTSRLPRGLPDRSLGPNEAEPDDTTPRLASPTYRETEPPTEFQRYVKTATGRLLPIFGASLFDRVPSTFAPLDRVPVTPDYVVGPGDELQVRVWGQINFSQRLQVDRNGAIYLPEVGSVSAAGLSYAQLGPALKSAIGRVYRNFDLSVNLGQLRTIQIFVVGQARRPGNYTVSSLSTLVNALFASGGPSSRGSLRRIQLKRGEKVVSEIDLYIAKFLSTASLSSSVNSTFTFE